MDESLQKTKTKLLINLLKKSPNAKFLKFEEDGSIKLTRVLSHLKLSIENAIRLIESRPEIFEMSFRGGSEFVRLVGTSKKISSTSLTIFLTLDRKSMSDAFLFEELMEFWKQVVSQRCKEIKLEGESQNVSEIKEEKQDISETPIENPEMQNESKELIFSIMSEIEKSEKQNQNFDQQNCQTKKPSEDFLNLKLLQSSFLFDCYESSEKFSASVEHLKKNKIFFEVEVSSMKQNGYRFFPLSSRQIMIKGPGGFIPANFLKSIEANDTQLLSPEIRSKISEVCEIERIILLDFEVNSQPKPKPSVVEIIEFPSLLINLKDSQIERSFHSFVKFDNQTSDSPPS